MNSFESSKISNTNNPEIELFFERLKKASKVCNFKTDLTSGTIFIFILLISLNSFIIFETLITPVKDLKYDFYLIATILINFTLFSTSIMSLRKLSFFKVILSFINIIDNFSMEILNKQIITNLKDFIHSQKKYEEEKDLKKEMDHVLALLTKLERFQNHHFYKTKEFNILASYTSYISSTENIKEILDLIFNVKIRLTDIVLRNKLKNSRYGASFFNKYRLILENKIEEIEHGINSLKIIKEMSYAKKSFKISIIALISSIIIPFLLEYF
ncbi:hypothetical protein [Candidatus Lokiarchaeum ossiferum]|uniref:hypothetical protein n=1 Tax=Candidatus Lokiarchaeum ossiferum TaxID=2951803 RepID=UPI00352E7601